jgi:hypothetical protein
MDSITTQAPAEALEDFLCSIAPTVDADGSLILTDPVLEASLDLPARLLVRLLAAGKFYAEAGHERPGADRPRCHLLSCRKNTLQ